MKSVTFRALAPLAVGTLVLTSCGGGSDSATSEAPQSTVSVTADDTDDTSTADTSTDDTSQMATGTDAPAAPNGEPIKIGVLTSITGNFAPWGAQVEAAAELAIADLNAAGGIAGQPVELIVADDQSNAEEGIAQFERLVEDGAVAVIGGISSDVGLAVSTTAEEHGVPYFLIKAGSGEILTSESRYTFRSCLPAAPMLGEMFLQVAQSEGISKVGAIVADYGWGRAIESTLTDTFAAADGIELQVEVAPVGAQDFTTYLRNLESFEPGLLVSTGHPPGGGAITVQSNDLGMTVPQVGSMVPMNLIADAAPDAAIGRYSDIKCADFTSAGYEELATRYLAASDNAFMSDDAVATYAAVIAVAEAATANPDPAATAEYLHANTFESPGMAFPLSWTEWGELAAATPTLTRVTAGPPPAGVSEGGDWWLETVVTAEPLTPYEP